MISFSLAAALAVALAQSPAQTKPVAPPPPPAKVQVATPNPFTNLFLNLGRDARSLATPGPLITLVAGGAVAKGVNNSNDQKVHDWVIKQPEVPALAHFGNFAGDAYFQGGVAVATWLVGHGQSNARLESTGADLIRAQVLNGALTVPLKLIVNRDRPDLGHYSFPSGHTSATFATAAVIHGDYGFAKALPFYALGGLVGWSRVRSNHHWLSDDMFGAAIGIASGMAVTHGNHGKWSVTPVKTKGGGAVFVVRR